jgi:hypothetical protein
MAALTETLPGIRSQVRVWELEAGYPPQLRANTKNQIQYAWAHIATRLLGLGDVAYAIRGMYIEFENVAAPGTPVVTPTFLREDGLEYYDTLVSSGTRDYFRVALGSLPLITVQAGYEAFFRTGEGNAATFMAQTAGLTGVHGKTFSSVMNSTIYGMALVATPVLTDPTQDVVFARTYLAAAEQVGKTVTSQVAVTWTIQLQ